MLVYHREPQWKPSAPPSALKDMVIDESDDMTRSPIAACYAPGEEIIEKLTPHPACAEKQERPPDSKEAAS
jgi:hypothetical protein